jgi:hypothetical protein
MLFHAQMTKSDDDDIYNLGVERLTFGLNIIMTFGFQ